MDFYPCLLLQSAALRDPVSFKSKAKHLHVTLSTYTVWWRKKNSKQLVVGKEVS